MRPRIILSLLLAIAVGVLGYWLFVKRPPADSASAQTSRNQAARAEAVPVVTAPVEQSDFPVRRRSIGLLESPAIVTVRPRLDSQMLEKHVNDGQLVRKGALLFTLDDREVRAAIARTEATLAKDQAAQERAAADLKRTEELISRSVAPRQQFDQMTAEFKAAEATVAADRAQLQTDQLKLGYTKIEAPITGRLGTIRVTPGNIVSTADTAGLVTITQIKPIRVSFTLAERELTALRAALRRSPSPTVRVYTHGDPKPLASGELNFVDSSVDSTTGTINAKATFANEDLTLWPGQYVDVEVDLDSRPNTASVPTVALQTGQRGPFVFVVGNDERVELRQVEVGGIERDRTAILEGVKPGERVVVEGQLRLANGARVRETKQAATPPKTETGAAPPQPVAKDGVVR
jgi:multidrug efflux system membrane fusion protein